MAEGIEQLIDQIAAEYGIPDWVARGIAYGENTAFNPEQVTTEADGRLAVGIYQVHDVNEKSVEKRQDPEWNIRWAMENSVGPGYKSAVAAGLTEPAEILEHIWKVGQRASAAAIPGGVQRAMSYLGQDVPVTAAGQGGGTMTNGQTTNDWVQRILDEAKALMEEGGAINLDAAGRLLQTIPSDIRMQLFGGAAAEPPEHLEAPSPQAVEIKQFELEDIALKLGESIKEKGLGWAAEEFKNQVTALQEGRKTADYALDYASRIAPPGMTTVPFTGPESAVGQMAQKVGFTPSPALPLPLAPTADPYQALGQAQQFGPQPPSLQYQAPSVPQVPNLSELSGFPQVMPMPTFGGADLPTGGGGRAPTGGVAGTPPALTGFAGPTPPPMETWGALEYGAPGQLPMEETAGEPDFARILAQILQMFGGGAPMVGGQLPLRAG